MFTTMAEPERAQILYHFDTIETNMALILKMAPIQCSSSLGLEYSSLYKLLIGV